MIIKTKTNKWQIKGLAYEFDSYQEALNFIINQ